MRQNSSRNIWGVKVGGRDWIFLYKYAFSMKRCLTFFEKLVHADTVSQVTWIEIPKKVIFTWNV